MDYKHSKALAKINMRIGWEMMEILRSIVSFSLSFFSPHKVKFGTDGDGRTKRSLNPSMFWVEQSEYRNEVYHSYLNIDRTIVFTPPFIHSYHVAHMFFSLKWLFSYLKFSYRTTFCYQGIWIKIRWPEELLIAIYSLP